MRQTEMKSFQIILSVLGLRFATPATLRRASAARNLAVVKYWPRYTTYSYNNPSYSTELECCKATFPNQNSGTCLSMLPAPPTVSPTSIDGPNAWYANYDLDFTKGVCINKLPTPTGRTIYDTQLECCKGAYGGQTSGACIKDLPAPPTVSPTPTGGVEIWYQNPDIGDWTKGYCINKLPTPNDAATYDSELDCCKGAYAGQSSGKCLSMLPAPPTVSPTQTGGPDEWYADFDLDWTNGVCINTLPQPSGRTIYDSQLECCKGAYAGQESGKCLRMLPAPPTSSPIGSDAEFFPIWSNWESGYCDNDPTKNTAGTSEKFATQSEC
jgi:hypothetical protein